MSTVCEQCQLEHSVGYQQLDGKCLRCFSMEFSRKGPLPPLAPATCGPLPKGMSDIFESEPFEGTYRLGDDCRFLEDAELQCTLCGVNFFTLEGICCPGCAHPAAFPDHRGLLPPLPSAREREWFRLCGVPRPMNVWCCFSYCLHRTIRYGGFYERVASEKFLKKRSKDDGDDTKVKTKLPLEKLFSFLVNLHDTPIQLLVIDSDGQLFQWVSRKRQDDTDAPEGTPTLAVMRTTDGHTFWPCEVVPGGTGGRERKRRTSMQKQPPQPEAPEPPKPLFVVPKLPSLAVDQSLTMSAQAMSGSFSPTKTEGEPKEEEEEEPEAKHPFENAVYPSFEMGNCGIGTIIKAAFHPFFKMNKIRFLATMILCVALLTVACVVLALVRRQAETCCEDSPFQEGTSSECGWNATFTPQCDMDHCNDMQKGAMDAFLWGRTYKAPAMIVCIIVVGSVLLLIFNFGVTFFLVRSYAISAQQRCWKVLYLVTVIMSVLMIASCVLLFLGVRPNRYEVPCSAYATSRGEICESMQNECQFSIVAFFRGTHRTVKGCSIACLSISILLLFATAVPPPPDEDIEDDILPSKPDTGIFRQGPYFPDGPTQDQLDGIEEEVRTQWKKESLLHVRAQGKKGKERPMGSPRPFLTGGAVDTRTPPQKTVGQESRKIVYSKSDDPRKAENMRAIRGVIDPVALSVIDRVALRVKNQAEPLPQNVGVERREPISVPSLPLDQVPQRGMNEVPPSGSPREALSLRGTAMINKILRRVKTVSPRAQPLSERKSTLDTPA